MTLSKRTTVPLILGIVLSLAVIPLSQEAFASCWWCGSHGDGSKTMYFKVGYQHPCDNGSGNCVTMSNHWQPIKSGQDDTLGIYTENHYEWIRPVVQAETRDITAHASWSAYVLAVDKNNSYVTSDSETFSKRYIYGIPQSETSFERSDDSAPKNTLVTALISVSQISD